MSRARSASAALAVVTTGAAALLLALAPAQAAAPGGTSGAARASAQPEGMLAAAATPVTTGSGTRTLVVDPTTDLPSNNASIRVRGEGFSIDTGLYIAVCADGSGAPQDLTDCVGGAIPQDNTTTGWGHVTTDGQGPGGVNAAWGDDGSFDITLALPLVTEGGVNCVAAACSLYTASDDDSVRTEDYAVPLRFAAPASSSSSAPSTPPGTAIPQVIQSPSVVAGGTQLVVFSGFRPNETVNLTLFSPETDLPAVSADSTGVARAEFVVPADSTEGTYRLEAIGQQSGTIGVASFQVTVPVVPSSPTPTPSPTPSPTPTPSSSPASSSSASSSAAASSVVSSSSSAAAGDDDGSSLWWLWLIIAVVVLAGIITGIVVYRRNQQAQREQQEKDIADAAAREQQTRAAGFSGPPPAYGADAPTVFLPPVPPAGGPPPGADPYGLLSGRDHPDNPSLYSGGPTDVIGPPPGGQGPGPHGQPPGYGGPQQPRPPQPPVDPPTQALPPAGGRPPAGPPSGGQDGTGTQAWRPDFDDGDPSGKQ